MEKPKSLDVLSHQKMSRRNLTCKQSPVLKPKNIVCKENLSTKPKTNAREGLKLNENECQRNPRLLSKGRRTSTGSTNSSNSPSPDNSHQKTPLIEKLESLKLKKAAEEKEAKGNNNP